MVLGRRSFLRSLATAVVGVGIAPKIFLAQTEVIPIEPFGSLVPPAIFFDPLMPPGRIDYMNMAAWGKIKWGEPPFWFTAEGREVFAMKEHDHG